MNNVTITEANERVELAKMKAQEMIEYVSRTTDELNRRMEEVTQCLKYSSNILITLSRKIKEMEDEVFDQEVGR